MFNCMADQNVKKCFKIEFDDTKELKKKKQYSYAVAMVRLTSVQTSKALKNTKKNN